MDLPLKQLSNAGRRKLPVLTEALRLRHIRRRAFMSELIAELGSIDSDRRMLAEARGGSDLCWPADESDEPLVTVRIATRDRPEMLAERALASARAQTYERIEVVVVGDACDERTGQAIERLNDPRVRYVNLPRPGVYPEDPTRRWRVTGVKPMNVAVDLAAGTWIAPCDDDDELTPTHVESLLSEAKRRRLEFVWSKSEEIDIQSGSRSYIGSPLFGRGCTTHGAVLYSYGLTFLTYSVRAERLSEPADWNLMKRMRLCGVRMGYLDECTYRYFVAGPEQYRKPQDVESQV